jgi:dipeptidyl-peptidase-4
VARVTWLPDSSGVATHLLTRVQDKLRLVLAGRAVVSESSDAWINLRDDFAFLGDSLLWGSERGSGYRHLSVQPLRGGSARPLTRGDWEVTDLACVDQKGGRVFYVSTEPDARERHLWSVGLDGSDKRRISREPGTHSVSMGPGCSTYVDTWSSLSEPTRRTVRSADGRELGMVREPDGKVAAEYGLLPNELVDYNGSDGTLFHARLIRPAGFDRSRKYPAVVMVYAGPHVQAVRNQWRGADWDQALAHRGFVVWQVDGRGSAGRGHVFEKPLNRRLGKLELADQVEGVRHLLSLGFVDPARVGIYGWSYGGYMTLNAMFNAGDVFAAGVAGAPVTDWRQYDTIYTERYMGLPQENEAGYKESSVVHQAARLKGRLMLAHNFEDDNVLFQHTLRMMDELQRAGKQFDLLLYPQKSHAVSGGVKRHMLESMTAFLERHLKAGGGSAATAPTGPGTAPTRAPRVP